jgi:hypothetical protein
MAIATGPLGERLGIDIKAEKLQEMGFSPAQRPEGKRAGVFWLESDIPAIARGISAAMLLIAEAEQSKLDADDEI